MINRIFQLGEFCAESTLNLYLSVDFKTFISYTEVSIFFQQASDYNPQ